jgi:uncharacterized membrane protein (UPF0182 family)
VADFLTGLQFYLPHVLAMISLLVVGLLIAWLVSFVARHLLHWGRFDSMAEHFGAAEMLKRAGLPAASIVVASLLFWLVWAAFMLSGLGALGVSGIETLSANFVNFLPRLVVAVVILVVGLLAANFAWRTTLLAAVNANLPSARLLSGAVRWLIATLAVAMALEQIGVAKTIMLTRSRSRSARDAGRGDRDRHRRGAGRAPHPRAPVPRDAAQRGAARPHAAPMTRTGVAA